MERRRGGARVRRVLRWSQRPPWGRSEHRAVSTIVVAATALALLAPSRVSGQTLGGHVLDEQDDRPIPGALIRLVDGRGEERVITLADSSGAYRVRAPEPGVYRLLAERIGFDSFETPLLEMRDAARSYPLDLLMRAAPVPIRGLEVTAAEADRQIRRMIGMNPRSLRSSLIHREEILDHVGRAHDLTDLMRWGNNPGIVVRRSIEGPCFEETRHHQCLQVYLNGFHMSAELIAVLPLELANTIVVLYPNETLAYPAGAVLVYTEAWLR